MIDLQSQFLATYKLYLVESFDGKLYKLGWTVAYIMLWRDHEIPTCYCMHLNIIIYILYRLVYNLM